MNEKGAVLPSIIVFVFLLLVILLGSVKIYHDQMHQLFATKESYNAKSMLELTEKELISRLDNLETIETGTAVFQNGKVFFEKTTSHRFQLKAVTVNQFSLTKQIEHVVSESSEILEEITSEEEESKEKENSESNIEHNPIDQTDESQREEITE